MANSKIEVMKLTEREAASAGVIMIFGDLAGRVPVRAMDLFNTLMDKNTWYSSRSLRPVPKNLALLFYGKNIGFCGTASVSEQVSITRDDANAHRLGLYGFRMRFVLSNIQRFENPVAIRPLLVDLSFIRNKKAWGAYFRASGIRIPSHDLALITKAANRTQGMPRPAQ
jgi:hypothetical protein